MITSASLAGDLRRLGVPAGAVLVVHTALSRIGWVEEGPTGVIRALEQVLGPDGTLVMPSMTDGETPYDPAVTPTVDMGIVAETFWRLPGVLRSDHPSSACAARGPLAPSIVATHPLHDPQGPDSPIGQVHRHDGWVLLLGVDHDTNTTIHLAETLSGVPYRRIKRWRVGDEWVRVAEIDHCCQGFRRLAGPLRERGLVTEGPVGRGIARLMRSRDVVQVACELLSQDPYWFLCPQGRCPSGQCDEARAYAREHAAGA